MLQKFWVCDFIKHRIPRRHGHRIAAISRTMCAWHHMFCCVRRRDYRAEREAAANAFGHGHNVRLAAVYPLMGKKLTRPRRAALHFIIDEEDTMLIAHLA